MNIANIHNCYGCGMCATVCARSVIDIKLNADGFYEPLISDTKRCTDCGLCAEVCSFLHDDIASECSPVASYAAWSKSEDIRHKCSSGGVAYEISRTLVGKGYVFCGARYNVSKNIVEHYISDDIEGLEDSIGSKYIQSYTLEAFKAIDRKKKHVVVGTPCQIDSFRRYIRKFKCEDNFILIDFFCHGVPSKLMWDKYLASVSSKVGQVKQVSWRNKFTSSDFIGWRQSYNMHIVGEQSESYSPSKDGDSFYKLFFSDSCLNKACYDNCHFKHLKSSADIRVGDFWGNKYKDNKFGVSCVLAFTPEGNNVISSLDCALCPESIEAIIEAQMKNNAQPPNYKYLVWNVLRINCSSISNVCFVINCDRIFKKIIRKIRVILSGIQLFSAK